jgi:hypothetical protein
VALFSDATADIILDAAVEEGTDLDGLCPMGHGTRNVLLLVLCNQSDLQSSFDL